MTVTLASIERSLNLRRVFSADAWALSAGIIALVLALPILAVVWIAFSATDSIWPHLISTVLPRALTNTVLLLAGAGAVSLAIGTLTAWIVTMFRFPGREIADRLLVLPMAMPVYIVAYAYVELLDFAGPLQTGLRDTFGAQSALAHIIPDVRSLSGAIGLFSLVLYPYVYLTARASFVQQSVCALEVARTLGRTASGAFWSVALPMARPALVAGVALVMMECLNDLGAVQYLGVETLSASIYATWTQRSNLPGAAQLALVMLALVVALLIGERRLRGEASFHASTGRFRAIPFEALDGWRAAVALASVAAPVVLGFAVPFLVLVNHAIAHFGGMDEGAFLTSARNSLVLASLVSGAAVVLALFFAYAARLHKSPVTWLAARVTGLGYALPGTVLAIGLLAPLAALDNGIDAWMRSHIGVSTGLILSGSLFAVTLALVIRFLAVAHGTIESGLERISPNIDAAAKTLGAGSLSSLRRIHLPMLKPAIGAAALLVFVDAMKELPATLLLRPFNFETLATRIYGLTAAEQFEEAAIGAVAIVVIGLIPVLLLHKAIAGGRTGGPA
jgi:iron(III) transport system permease protein